MDSENIKVEDKGKMSFNRRLVDLERTYDHLEGELSRMRESFIKMTEYVNTVVDRIDRDNKEIKERMLK